MKLFVIGSGNNAHIKLNSPFVSAYHAELLFLDNGEMLLTDKESKNGTFLNDQKLVPNKDISVKRGDDIRIADQQLDWNIVPELQMPDISKIKEMRGIGTNFRNKYQLQGERVSRFHATLKRNSDGKWYIQDHSKNGTTINGQRITPNQDVRLKRGDKILCAGVAVPNPCGDRSSKNYKKLFTILSIVILSLGGVFGVYRMVKHFAGRSDSGISKNIVYKEKSDEEIYATYRNSVVLLIGFYYYEVSAGNLDLEKVCGLPTAVVWRNGRPEPVTRGRSDMNSYTGTGFYVSEDGKIVTNQHIARPWLYNNEQSLIAEKYEQYLASAAADYPILNAYLSKVKVKGVLSYIGMLPNGSYLCDENMKRCRELVVPDEIQQDVAVLQLESRNTPEGVTPVDLGHAVVDDSKIRVGSHIYTMGFPFGLSIQDLESQNGVRLLANGGSITQECSEYSFGFNAPSYGGASGSPIFNEKGQLIGVLNSGIQKTQGFNFGIKAIHVKQLLGMREL